MAMRIFLVMAFMDGETIRQSAVFGLGHFPAEGSGQSRLLPWRQFFGQGELKLLEQPAVCPLMDVSGLPIISGGRFRPNWHIAVSGVEQFGMVASVPAGALNIVAADGGAGTLAA